MAKKKTKKMRLKLTQEKKEKSLVESPLYWKAQIGPKAEMVDTMSPMIIKAVLKSIIRKLDDEDAQGTFGKQGWRNYLLGPVEPAKEGVTSEESTAA